MSEYPNSGILSRNKKRETDSQPEFTGSAEIDGVKYWQSAWIKEGKFGKFFSIKYKRKDDQTPNEPSTASDGEVPF